MDGGCWVCFCGLHSLVQDIDVRIFGVRAMGCMCAQTRLQFTLPSKNFFGEWSQKTHVNSKGKNALYRKKIPQRRIEPKTLHQAGQGAQHITNELFRPPPDRSVDRVQNHWKKTLHSCLTLNGNIRSPEELVSK